MEDNYNTHHNGTFKNHNTKYKTNIGLPAECQMITMVKHIPGIPFLYLILGINNVYKDDLKILECLDFNWVYVTQCVWVVFLLKMPRDFFDKLNNRWHSLKKHENEKKKTMMQYALVTLKCPFLFLDTNMLEN